MAKYDEYDELRDIAVDIDHQNPGRSFYNRESFDDALERSGRGTYLTQAEKDRLYDDYSDYNMSYYNEKKYEQEHKEFLEREERDRAERERIEQEREAVIAEIHAEMEEEIRKERYAREKAESAAYGWWHTLKDYKYGILEAKTAYQRMVVDKFDKEVNTPEFQAFYEKTTGKAFIPVENVILESLPKYDDVSGFVDYYHPKETREEYGTKRNVLEKQIDTEKRKEAYAEYGKYFEDMSFEFYQRCQEDPELEQRGIEGYRNYKKDFYAYTGTPMPGTGERVPITPFEIAQKYFHYKFNQSSLRRNLSSFTRGDVKEFAELKGITASSSTINSIPSLANSIKSRSYQKLIQGINKSLHKAEDNLTGYLSRKYMEQYLVRFFTIVVLLLNLCHLFPRLQEFAGHPFVAVWGIASNLVNAVLVWFVFAKKYDLLGNLDIGFNPFGELLREKTKKMLMIVLISVVTDCYLLNYEVSATKAVLFIFAIHKIGICWYYYHLFYRNPAPVKERVLYIMLCTIAFLLAHGLTLTMLTGRLAKPGFTIEYYIDAFSGPRIIKLIGIFASVPVGIYAAYKVYDEICIPLELMSPLDVKERYQKLLEEREYRIFAEKKSASLKTAGIMALIGLFATIVILFIPKVPEMKQAYQEKKMEVAAEKEREEYLEQQKLKEELAAQEEAKLTPEVLGQAEEDSLGYINSNVMLYSIYCDIMAEFGYAISFELANIEEMQQIPTKAGRIYANMDYLNTNNEFVYGAQICLNDNENNYDTLDILLNEVDDMAYMDAYIVKLYYSWVPADSGEKVKGPEEIFRINTNDYYDSYEEYLAAKGETEEWMIQIPAQNEADSTVEQAIEPTAAPTTDAITGTTAEPAVALTAEPTPEVSNVPVIAQIVASSNLVENNFVYAPEQACDGDISTAWVEGVSGYGVGETLTLTLSETSIVNGLCINNGYQKSEALYEKNSRPASLLITFSNGETETVALEDVCRTQEINFQSSRVVDYISITIDSVYPGSKYEDTVISEIALK